MAKLESEHHVPPVTPAAQPRPPAIDPRLDAVSARDWLETHRQPFVLIDADYVIVAANEAYANTYGTRPEAIVGRKCHRVSHRSDEPCHRHGEHCPHQIVFATAGSAEVVHVHYDARGRADRVRLSAHPLRLPDGQLLMSESIERLESIDDAEADAFMVGNSPPFNRMIARLHDAAANDLPLLLSGETGAGKELAARWVHRNSARAVQPLVVIDCTAIPESLFEAELFGYERGAFSGPTQRRIGLVEEAHRGTLFFDEIGELPLSMQAKLLRFLETGEFRRLGSNQLRQVDCRIISATHRPIDDPECGTDFRRDLYFRLAAQLVRVPALRERRGDIDAIADAILRAHCRKTGSPGLSASARAWLLAQSFPGNVRELRNLLLRAAQRAGATHVDIVHLQPDAAAGPRPLPAPAGAGAQQPSCTPAFGAAGVEAPRTDPGEAALALAADRYAAARRSDLGSLIGAMSARGLSRRRIAEHLGISERTVYRHLARLAKPR